MALTSLPRELLSEIASHLSNSDIGEWRLACKRFSLVALHIDRVFISANPKDIEVFRAIADHETQRCTVKEIVWDEGRFEEDPRSTWCRHCWARHRQSPDTPPNDYARACERNLAEMMRRRCNWDADLPHHLAKEERKENAMKARRSWSRYREHLAQQRRALADDLDIKAFKHGLERFTALRRITLTPAAHGFAFMPLYRTPTIRRLIAKTKDNKYMNYKLPRGWPTAGDDALLLEARNWNTEADKAPWRGFTNTIRLLAENQGPAVTELVLDVRQLLTGLTCRFFDRPCPEFDHLVAVLRRPGFRRLDLALMVGGQQYDGWKSLRNGRLRLALEQASSNLEHIHLGTDVRKNPDWRGSLAGGGHPDHFTPLRSLLPLRRWPKLRHFGLSRFLVRQDDLLSLLAELPGTVRTIELSFLYFLDGGGSYRDLLEEMKSTLGWQSRDVAERPKVVIKLEMQTHGFTLYGRALWLDKELDLFFYDGGKNPFRHDDEHWSPNIVLEGEGGGTERDEFDPAHERPHADHYELVRLGIHRRRCSWQY
ncbi:hypothetical protein TgHK011_006889 [Trichoderma gracile]|nr:hypothetical protein TgHK011_006889 [Trichoderma gracile]